MTRAFCNLITVALALLLSGAPALGANPTEVQLKGATGGVGTTLNVVFTSTPTIGNYVVAVGYTTNNTSVSTVRDSLTNVVALLNGAQVRTWIHGYVVPSGGVGTTYQGTSTVAGNYQDLGVVEITNVNTSQIFTGSCQASSSCTATPSQSTGVGVAVCTGNNASSNYTGTTLNNIIGSQTNVYNDINTSVAVWGVSTGSTTCTGSSSAGTLRTAIVVLGSLPSAKCIPYLFLYPCWLGSGYPRVVAQW